MKKLVYTGILLFASLTSFSQYAREEMKDSTYQPSDGVNHPSAFWQHVSIGGGFGLQFGTLTYIALSPMVCYHINNDIMIGAGPVYQYYSYSDYTGTSINNIYGGRVDAYIFLPGVLHNVFLQGEYDMLNVPDNYSIFANITRAIVYIPLAGIGIRRPIGENSFYTLSFMWDFSNSVLSPYINPVISAGVDFGI